MFKERTNILIMGTLASGASALVDMLKEYENVNVLPDEFVSYRRPGFVADQLSYNSSLDYPSVIDGEITFENYKWELIYKSSIWKLFSAKGLKNAWDKEWGHPKLKAYKNSLISLYHIFFLKELNKSLRSDISFEEKIRLSSEWIHKIGNVYPSANDFILYNQPLHPWFDTEIWTKVFSPFKLIYVLRDPKDQLAEMIRREIVFSPFRDAQISYGQFNIVSIYGNDRKGRIRFVMDALKKRLEILDQWVEKLGPEQLLLIDFEGLSKNYDSYKSEIENFLGLRKDKHKFAKKYFDPDIAMKKGIGIFKDYLSAEELEDLSDLEAWYNNKFKKLNH